MRGQRRYRVYRPSDRVILLKSLNEMKKCVSIVLSPSVSNYRKLAQRWYGLTDEQMEGMHVHHNPPRSDGGRNIIEHLFVYSEHLHDLVHGGNGYCLSASKGGKKGGNSNAVNKTGFCSEEYLESEKAQENQIKNGKKGGEVTGAKAQKEKIGFFGLSEEELTKARKKAGKKAVDTGQILTIATPESRRKGGETSGKKNSHYINKVKWRCTVCGEISTAAGLSHIQRARGIDKSNRERVYTESDGV
jgi:hypothetical protein